jgi:hypothetical protein
MNWNEIIKAIREDLLSRNLKQPNRRLNALAKIDTIMKQHFKKYVENPKLLNSIIKDDLKSEIAKIEKVQELSGAESSIINEIYYRI